MVSTATAAGWRVKGRCNRKVSPRYRDRDLCTPGTEEAGVHETQVLWGSFMEGEKGRGLAVKLPRLTQEEEHFHSSKKNQRIEHAPG